LVRVGPIPVPDSGQKHKDVALPELNFFCTPFDASGALGDGNDLQGGQDPAPIPGKIMVGWMLGRRIGMAGGDGGVPD